MLTGYDPLFQILAFRPLHVVSFLLSSFMTAKERTINTCLLMLLPPGIMASGWAIYHFPVEKVGGGLITLSIVTIFFSAFLRIKIPGTELHLTISDALVFLSLLFYGGPVAVILAMLEAASSSGAVRACRRVFRSGLSDIHAVHERHQADGFPSVTVRDNPCRTGGGPCRRTKAFCR